MSFKRKFLAIALCISFLVIGSVNFAFARGSGDVQNAKNEITYVNFRDLRNLSPHQYGGEMFAQNLLYESLVKIKKDGSFAPWLAKSWSISEDGKTYVFKLRQDVYFSDGEKFNAKSAKANFDAILDNHKRHGWLESVRLMMAVKNGGKDPIQATGKYELTVHLAEPYYPLLIEFGVTRPFRFISPKAFKDGTTKNGVKAMIGTGTYVLKNNKVNEYSVFERNDNYWGAKPKIQKIIAKVIPDSQTRLLALQNGEVDLIFGSNMMDAAAYNRFSKMSGFKALKSQPVSARMMLLNTTDEILSDLKVRQAIQHATDKQKISLGLFDGLELPADTLFAKNVPYADVGLKPYNFSFEQAKKLLDSAGWKKVSGKKYRYKNGKELKITLNYDSNNVTEKNVGEFLQGQYAKIGINLDILGEEEQAYEDRLKTGKFTFTFNVSWGVPYDPQSFLGAMTQDVYGDYKAQIGLKNKKELDKNILSALKSVSEEKRQKHYKYVLETLHNQAVYLPLTYDVNKAIFNDKVKGVGFNISKFEVPFEKMSIEE